MEFPIITTGREHVDRFINEIAPIVCNEYIRRVKNGDRRILPCTVIAQGALESGYNINAKTLFGIKGEGVSLDTTEYVNGTYINITDSFKAYPTISAAVQGYYDLMQSDRYAPATSAIEYIEECKQLYICGYATDPSYSAKLIQIIERNNLEQFNLYCFSVIDEDNDIYTEVENKTETTYYTDNNGVSYSMDDLVEKLINGDYGNGRDVRLAAFLAQGFTEDVYETAQTLVNQRLNS